MKTFKADEKQQKILADFFKEETSYFPNHVLLTYLACLLVGISMILLTPPMAVWEGEKILSLYSIFLYCFGMSAYSARYASYSEPLMKKQVSVTSLLRYVPVEKDQLMIFRIRKILKPCVILTLIVLLFRIAVSLGVYGSISFWDIVFPPLAMILLPVFFELVSPGGMFALSSSYSRV